VTQRCSQAWRSEKEFQVELITYQVPSLVHLDELTGYLDQLEKRLRDCHAAAQTEITSLKSRDREIADLEGKIRLVQHAIKAKVELLSLAQQSKQRSPMEMIRDEYKGMKLGDIANQVMKDKNVPLTTTELSRLIYATQSDDEFARARNSLSAELRAGAKGQRPQWRKLGRYAYASL
jgi:hypothetical protein